MNGLSKEHLVALYVGFVRSLKNVHAREFLEPYLEFLEEYHEESGLPAPTVEDAIGSMEDNVNDMNKGELYDLFDQAMAWMIAQGQS
jgi:hypothetical protein